MKMGVRWKRYYFNLLSMSGLENEAWMYGKSGLTNIKHQTEIDFPTSHRLC